MATKTTLLRQYDELENDIEQSARGEVWALAYWLAENVPLDKPGPKIASPSSLTTQDIAAHGRRDVRWLQEVRRVALAFGDDSIPHQFSVKEHSDALKKSRGDVAKAIKLLTKIKIDKAQAKIDKAVANTKCTATDTGSADDEEEEDDEEEDDDDENNDTATAISIVNIAYANVNNLDAHLGRGWSKIEQETDYGSPKMVATLRKRVAQIEKKIESIHKHLDELDNAKTSGHKPRRARKLKAVA